MNILDFLPKTGTQRIAQERDAQIAQQAAAIEAQKNARLAEIDALRRSREIEDVGKAQEMMRYLTTALGSPEAAQVMMARIKTGKDIADTEVASNVSEEALGARPHMRNVGSENAQANVSTAIYKNKLGREGAKILDYRDPYVRDLAESGVLSEITGNLGNVTKNQLGARTDAARFDTAPTTAVAQDRSAESGFNLVTARNNAAIPLASRSGALSEIATAINAETGIDEATRKRALAESIPLDVQKQAMLSQLQGGVLQNYAPLLTAPVGSVAQQFLYKNPDAMTNILSSAFPAVAPASPNPSALQGQNIPGGRRVYGNINQLRK